MALSIDPNVKAIINGVITLCGVIATLGVNVFPDYVPPGIAKDVVQTAGLIFMLYGGANTAGNLLSSNKPGALAPDVPPVVVAAQKVADLPPSASPGTVAAAKAAASSAIVAHQP